MDQAITIRRLEKRRSGTGEGRAWVIYGIPAGAVGRPDGTELDVNDAAITAVARALDPGTDLQRRLTDHDRVADECGKHVCSVAAGTDRVIRIDAAWLAVEPLDMRAGTDTALARVVSVFGQARAYHAYLFANRRASRNRPVSTVLLTEIRRRPDLRARATLLAEQAERRAATQDSRAGDPRVG
jgi:hypothetical protein